MEILAINAGKRDVWNMFVIDNFPPVGAFLQSFEWGTFKETLHAKILRFAVVENGTWLATLQLEIHRLPFGYYYGYAPRGPVLQKDLWNNESRVKELFDTISAYFKKEHRYLLYVRFEPPHQTLFDWYKKRPFTILKTYLQPRFNRTVTVTSGKEGLLTQISRDIRHDVSAAERLGITVEVKATLDSAENEAFEAMKRQTSERNGKNIYPSDQYFTNLLQIISNGHEATKPYMRFFVAKKEGQPVAIYLSVLFASTVTYLYGGSYSGSISKRAPAYLHWSSMLHAHEKGFTYYDLGGVDKDLWPGLTYFKEQFGGETFEYIGTIDLVLRPFYYRLYSLAKKIMSLKPGR